MTRHTGCSLGSRQIGREASPSFSSRRSPSGGRLVISCRFQIFNFRFQLQQCQFMKGGDGLVPHCLHNQAQAGTRPSPPHQKRAHELALQLQRPAKLVIAAASTKTILRSVKLLLRSVGFAFGVVLCVVVTGCGGISASPSVSPATFLLMQNEGRRKIEPAPAMPERSLKVSTFSQAE